MKPIWLLSASAVHRKLRQAIYLANRGIKTANIPIVHGVPLPEDLAQGHKPLSWSALIASVDRIAHVRQNRVSGRDHGISGRALYRPIAYQRRAQICPFSCASATIGPSSMSRAARLKRPPLRSLPYVRSGVNSLSAHDPFFAQQEGDFHGGAPNRACLCKSFQEGPYSKNAGSAPLLSNRQRIDERAVEATT
jgi:hypothetical protein